MTKQISEENKVRISGSMHQDVIDKIKAHAKKERRSFSDMNESLVIEALLNRQKSKK